MRNEREKNIGADKRKKKKEIDPFVKTIPSTANI